MKNLNCQLASIPPVSFSPLPHPEGRAHFYSLILTQLKEEIKGHEGTFGDIFLLIANLRGFADNTPPKGTPFGGGLLAGAPVSNYPNFYQKRLAFIDICVL